MSDKAQFIGTPDGYVKSVTNSTVAADLCAPATGVTIRLDNMTIRNNHTATVTVQIIRYDGTAEHVVYASDVVTVTQVNVLDARFGGDPSKQFMIVKNPHVIRIRATTAVAGAITVEANGGAF